MKMKLLILLLLSAGFSAHAEKRMLCDRHCSWDEPERRFTGSASCDRGTSMRVTNTRSSHWGASGYSTHSMRSNGILEYETELRSEVERYRRAEGSYSKEGKSEEAKAEIESRGKRYEELYAAIRSSHDTIVADCFCKSDGSWYDHRRGMIWVEVEFDCKDLR